MLTGQATVETAIEAMKLGAYDYLTKPYRIAELSVLVEQAAEKQFLKVDNQRLRAQIARTTGKMPDIVAQSPQMKEVLRLVQRVAPSETSVLITGESGTGKELIAQAIHRLSRRHDKPFIDLNCAALQDTLLESELFGHEAGAFSGARTRKLGLFEIAKSGFALGEFFRPILEPSRDVRILTAHEQSRRRDAPPARKRFVDAEEIGIDRFVSRVAAQLHVAGFGLASPVARQKLRSLVA